MNTSAKVREQYQQWIYPQPIEDIDNVAKHGRDQCDPDIQHYAYWPAMPYPANMRILIAGCGANQAACIAHFNPTATVHAVDLSESSLLHEQYLKEKYGLQNLSLEQRDICSLNKADDEFDLILSTGVLHHFSNPVEGLTSLRHRLAINGVIALMVYGKHYRYGVYMMQQLFQLLNLKQDQESLELVVATLDALANDHPAKRYINDAPDLHYAAGVVDTFLHVCDRAYDVADLLNWVKQCDLVFQNWIDPARYHADLVIPKTHPLHAKITALPPRQQWLCIELILAQHGTHFFYATHPERNPDSYVIEWDTKRWHNFIPIKRPGLHMVGDYDPTTKTGRLARYDNPAVALNEFEIMLFNLINGNDSIIQIFDQIDCDDKASALELTRQFFAAQWRMGHLFLKLPR